MHSGALSLGAHTALTQLPSLDAPEATPPLHHDVCVCVCVCVCVTYILLSFYVTTPIPILSLFSLPSVPSYTLTPRTPLLYANTCSSPFSLSSRLPVSSVPFFPPRFIHVRAQAVTSPLSPSALVAAKSATLCREGRGETGYWTSLLLVTSMPTQSHTFPSIPASACS